MHLPPSPNASHAIKSAYYKYLHSYEDFYRKLGSMMGSGMSVYLSPSGSRSVRRSVSATGSTSSSSETLSSSWSGFRADQSSSRFGNSQKKPLSASTSHTAGLSAEKSLSLTDTATTTPGHVATETAKLNQTRDRTPPRDFRVETSIKPQSPRTRIARLASQESAKKTGEMSRSSERKRSGDHSPPQRIPKDQPPLPVSSTPNLTQSQAALHTARPAVPSTQPSLASLEDKPQPPVAPNEAPVSAVASSSAEPSSTAKLTRSSQRIQQASASTQPSITSENVISSTPQAVTTIALKQQPSPKLVQSSDASDIPLPYRKRSRVLPSTSASNSDPEKSSRSSSIEVPKKRPSLHIHSALRHSIRSKLKERTAAKALEKQRSAEPYQIGTRVRVRYGKTTEKLYDAKIVEIVQKPFEGQAPTKQPSDEKNHTHKIYDEWITNERIVKVLQMCDPIAPMPSPASNDDGSASKNESRRVRSLSECVPEPQRVVEPQAELPATKGHEKGKPFSGHTDESDNDSESKAATASHSIVRTRRQKRQLGVEDTTEQPSSDLAADDSGVSKRPRRHLVPLTCADLPAVIKRSDSPSSNSSHSRQSAPPNTISGRQKRALRRERVRHLFEHRKHTDASTSAEENEKAATGTEADVEMSRSNHINEDDEDDEDTRSEKTEPWAATLEELPNIEEDLLEAAQDLDHEDEDEDEAYGSDDQSSTGRGSSRLSSGRGRAAGYGTRGNGTRGRRRRFHRRSTRYNLVDTAENDSDSEHEQSKSNETSDEPSSQHVTQAVSQPPPRKLVLPPLPPDRPERFDLHLEEGDCLEGDERIDFLMNKMKYIRQLFGELKAEVLDIDKKRRRSNQSNANTGRNNATLCTQASPCNTTISSSSNANLAAITQLSTPADTGSCDDQTEEKTVLEPLPDFVSTNDSNGDIEMSGSPILSCDDNGQSFQQSPDKTDLKTADC